MNNPGEMKSNLNSIMYDDNTPVKNHLLGNDLEINKDNSDDKSGLPDINVKAPY